MNGDEMLMTKLPGHANLAPADLGDRMRRLAEPLPVLHAARPPAEIALPYSPYQKDFSWVRDAGLRRAAEGLLAMPPPPVALVPCHGDYQHFNLLWSRGRLTGIVDWNGIWLAPPELDVSHCRLNLAVLYGYDAAEAFRRHYESHAGRVVNQWWDVSGIGSFGTEWPSFIPRQVAGRAPLLPGMLARVEELLRRAMA